MFQNCANLTNIDISNFDTFNVNEMGFMFLHYSKLTNIYVGLGWSTENANTTDMFSGCGTDHVTVKQN